MEKKQNMTGKQAYEKLSALCARSEHCQQELLDKMAQWGVAADEQAAVMARLVSERYVDDERFCRAFILDKIRYSKWGRRKIEQSLWMKHIDESISRPMLDDIEDEEYISVLKPMIRQKQRSTTGRNDYERYMKVIKWAMGRGYTMDIIRQCMDIRDEDELLD